MAKKLVYSYTFDASAQTITIKGRYTLRTLILITNVTDGAIIYNFADPGAGGSVSYDSAADETTITLAYNTTAMSDSDELQILADLGGDTEIEPSESLLDPVHKLRVSNPQNLIDTDFEYGLQSSKWETIELVDNIPSIYTRNSGVSIGEISQVNTISGSDVVTVICTTNHNLSIGDPIEVQGTKSRTANGKYIVTTAASNLEFTYRASAVQGSTQNIKESYTTIIPGSFFAGSDIKFDPNEGIETDNANPSQLTFTTDYKHGLSSGTSLYITNTVGKKIFNISNPSATATDGDPIINTSDESIFLAGHNFYNDQKLFIYPDTASNPSATLPTLAVGAPDPQGTTLINTAFNSVNTAVASLKSTMGNDFSRFYMYYTNASVPFYVSGNHWIYPREGTQGGLNDQQYQAIAYGDYQQNFNQTINTYNFSTGVYQTSYIWSPFGEGNSVLYTGQPVDFGQFFATSNSNYPSTLSGKVYGQWTKYVANAYTDALVSVKQFDASSIGRYYYNDQTYRSKIPNNSNYRFASSTGSDTLEPLGNGWYYAYAWTYYHPGNGSGSSIPGHIKFDITLWNTNWTYYNGDSASWGQYTYNYSTTSLSANDFRYRGSHYRIEVLLSLDADIQVSRYGSAGSVLTTAQMASTIATQVSNDLSYASWENTITGINTVRARVQDGNRITLTNDQTSRSPYHFTSTGSGPIKIETEQVSGVVDNYYLLDSVTSTTATIQASSQIAPRVLEFTDADIISDSSVYYIKISGGHGLKDGAKVDFDIVSGSTVSGLTDGTTYYAIVADNLHLRLASNTTNWESGISALTGGAGGAGSYTLTVSSIDGRVAASGTVDLTSGSNVVTGTNTKFLSNYKIGDNFTIVVGDGTVNTYSSQRIDSIVSDTSLTLASNSGFTTTSVPHYVDTKVNIRADGQFLHRPFDGGVEITAGASPDSTIVRQTRKYFRYQSGKGIQCSVAINFNPARPVRLTSGSGTSVTMTTEYPHGLTTGNNVKITGASDSAYNGTYTVTGATDFTFSYTAGSSVSVANPTGFVEYAISGYSNAGVRCGLFDFQNGFFYEYDGSNLYAVRRSSVQQLPGTVLVENGSNVVIGTNTRFQDNLSAGDYVVIRGQSYKVTSVESNTVIHMQPYYKGATARGAVVTKTIDTRVAQSQWNIDKADGSGPSGFNLDINKIQMAYLDYSWYGAGKIRFGFKDTYGKVKYVHEFIHNNKLNEAYMRSGNIPGRYEVFNSGIPTYVPSLFHWGTSVIMDGRFDDDDSYLFTAAGNTLTFTNGDTATATTSGASSLTSRRVSGGLRDYYVRIPFSISDATKFPAGISLYTAAGELNGETVAYTGYGSNVFYVYIFVQRSYTSPAIYPTVSSGTSVNIGAPTAGGGSVDLNTLIPLISIRLAPSVDNNIIGSVGERDIINRMQLKLKELGVSVSHDANISVILNGNLSNLTYENVGTPSLSQYVSHDIGDTINGGTLIYQFRASGGSEDANGKRFSQSSLFDLTPLSDLGNSILGGDDVFPNGPDIMTICATVIDTTEVDSGSSFRVSSRISWAESQA